MKTSLLTTGDKEIWNGYLARLPGADVYHTAEYHRAHEANGDGIGMAWVAEHYEALFLYPYMVRTIGNTDLCDVETVYGYSGPLTDCKDAAWLAKTAECFEQTCKQSKVVAEFIRFNPLTENHRLITITMNGGLTHDRDTVVLDLSGTEADILARAEKRHRGMLRKARGRGLRFVHLSLGRDIPEFMRLYGQTMQRNGAGEYYSFSAGYFEALHCELLGAVQLFGVQDDMGRTVAAALFLLHGDRMHYHLSGSDPDYPGYGDNNLLLHEAALWGQRRGYRWLHLGGGRTNATDDTLLRFKAGISRERRPFYIGRRIHTQEAYDRLCADWRVRHPGEDGGGHFLLWRKE